MPFVTLSVPPYGGAYSQTALPTRNWGPGEWASDISAGVQMCGLAKTQLEGFNIFSRVTRAYQQNNTSNMSPNFLVPWQVRTNDFMLVQVTTVSGTTITTPGGWTLIRSDTAAAGTGPVTQSIYYHYAAGTAGQFSTECGNTVTFVLSNTNQWASANLLVYGGVALASPINVQGATNGSSTTAAAGALTTTVPNAWVVQLCGNDYTATGNSITPPAAGYTTRANNNNPSGMYNIGNVSSAASDIFQAVAGTTGTPTFTLSVTASWVVQTIALVPTTSGANAFPTPTATPVSGGSLPSGTAVFYRISAISWANNGTGETLPCPEFSATPSGANLSIQLNWTQVPQAIAYRIYRGASGAEIPLVTVSGGATLTYTDTGAVTPSGVLNTVDTSADSNQISFGNAWIISTANTIFGYEIYQFTDTLQSTYPVFLRLQYQSGYTWNPQVTMIVGTATNGTGTIIAAPQYPNTFTTTPNSYLCYSPSTQWSVAAPCNVYFESDGGSSLTITGWINTVGSANPQIGYILGMVERTRDWDGTPNGEGVSIVWGGGGTYQCLLIANSPIFSGGAGAFTVNPTTSIITTSFPLVPSGIATIGSTIYVFPLLGANTPRLNAPSKHLVMIYGGDLAMMGTFSITIYGVTRTYQRSNVGLGGLLYAFRQA